MTDVIVMVLRQMLLPYYVVLWEMLLPCVCFGRCYCQYYVEDVKPHHVFQLIATSVMADVIAWWQMEWPLQGDFCYLWQML